MQVLPNPDPSVLREPIKGVNYEDLEGRPELGRGTYGVCTSAVSARIVEWVEHVPRRRIRSLVLLPSRGTTGGSAAS